MALTRVRDIIDEYESKRFAKIKADLAACENAHDYVYGSHQNRWDGGFDDVVKALASLKIQDWRFTNFEHLYDVIRTIFLLNGHRNAFLTIYDTALRIGYNHKEQILPSKFVYLYGNKAIGPLGSATTIYGKKWIDDHYDKDYKHRIKTRWFNEEKFPNLPSWEIESILCIYADEFSVNMSY